MNDDIETYLKFPKGTEIVCPKCKTLIAKANKDIYSHEKILSEYWEGIGYGSSPRCENDGTSYVRTIDGITYFSTPKGWMASPSLILSSKAEAGTWNMVAAYFYRTDDLENYVEYITIGSVPYDFLTSSAIHYMFDNQLVLDRTTGYWYGVEVVNDQELH